MLQDMYKETSVLRPVEVFTTVERRRTWSAQAKARIVAETFEPGAKVTEVARRHELSAQHLHQWRRAARAGKMVLPIDNDMAFAAVMVDGAPERRGAVAGLEIEVQGAVVRVQASTDLRLMAAVVRALKAAG
jgi:transposase